MPYIRQDERDRLDEGLVPLGLKIQTEGELNYAITTLCHLYLAGRPGTAPSYSDFNAVIGVLACAKQEMYRRRVAPYEDGKLSDNGDVYTLRLPTPPEGRNEVRFTGGLLSPIELRRRAMEILDTSPAFQPVREAPPKAHVVDEAEDALRRERDACIAEEEATADRRWRGTHVHCVDGAPHNAYGVG